MQLTPVNDFRVSNLSLAVDHYENFPVASILLPRRLVPAVEAIYAFARSADDLADEGDAAPAERLASLQAYEAALDAIEAGAPQEAPMFRRLAQVLTEFDLPLQPLRDLLSAFRQDVVTTRYADFPRLQDYCRRSANPVGRLMLHLYGVTDARALAQSDAICSALQLANFWQDLGVDLPRGRYYLPAADAVRHGIDPKLPQAWSSHANLPALVGDLCNWTRELMLAGAPLVHAVPGRAGWELRMVVQGGLRILRRIESMHCQTVQRRPTLGAADVVPMLWHALQM